MEDQSQQQQPQPQSELQPTVLPQAQTPSQPQPEPLPQPPIQMPQKKLNKGVIIAIVLIITAIFGSAALTKAGYIPNYLGVGFLSTGENVPMTLPYSQLPNDSGDYAMKPVIYLYPEHKQQVNVKLHYQGNLTVTYPEYRDGWNVTAYPDGKLVNAADSKEYSYLFWEGIDDGAKYDLSSGFVVKGSDTVSFLQDTLAKFGLTPKEYNEFIVYWLPRMQDNTYNIIHFASKEEYNDRALLDITPKPDSMLRVFMTFKKADSIREITPQEIKPFERKGFAVVEWGGTEL